MERNKILIEVDELLTKLNHQKIRIFDATITDDVYRQRHIPGAAYFDHERFSDPGSPYTCTLLPEPGLAAQIGRAGISNDSEVVVYACGMLPYAARAWWVLRYAGHENVRILNGGLTAWEEAGGPLESQAREYEPASFEACFRRAMFAGREEVMNAIDDKDTCIVDVLPPESYEASHIPSSVCLPCMDLMQAMDYFLPDDQLAPRLHEVARRGRIITYCGGGIAAAVNAVAHVMTGHSNVAVYDGSLYEWLGEGLPVDGAGKWEVWQTQ